jgi:hypothetical protein
VREDGPGDRSGPPESGAPADPHVRGVGALRVGHALGRSVAGFSVLPSYDPGPSTRSPEVIGTGIALQGVGLVLAREYRGLSAVLLAAGLVLGIVVRGSRAAGGLAASLAGS